MKRLKFAVLLSLFCLGCAASSGETQSQQATTVDAVNERIARIENFAPISLGANEPPVKLTLQQLMEISNVPGLSVAVFDNYKLVWAKGYGMMEAGGNTPVTTHTLFQAASISKPISAMAALRLVEQGKLSLDEDVNLKLKSWKVPENEFTKEQKVTLRRILTHTAGTTVHGVPGYEPGQPIPTLVQMLNGERPAISEPIRVDFVPGTKERYSGGGVMIEQQLMLDVTGKPFPQIMRELVFDKLGLKDSTFEEPLPASRAGAAASGHEGTGEVIRGKWEIYPEMATAGLWTTPSDLGGMAAEVALAKKGKSNRVLSAAMAREMLRLQVNPEIENAEGGPTMRMGLGWMLNDATEPGWFEHNGSNTGFRSEVEMSDSGHGVVVMVNVESFAGTCVMRYVINNIAKEYGWRYRYTPYTPWPYADTVLLAAAKLQGAQAAINKYYELKKLYAEQKEKGTPTIIWASNPPDYPPNEWDLYGLANTIADSKHLNDAIEIMKVDVQEYPKWAPGYSRLAELYARAGDKKLAIETYQKLLKLHPGDEDAIEALKKLKDTK